MTDWIGQQLGNYRIVRLLGRGGFAEVYLGEHVYLKSLAALKVLHTSLQDQDVQRFLSEAQTLVRLRHPYIVRVLEFAIERGAPVLIMDYAPWGTVRQQYPRGSRLPFATAVTYVKQVAAALQYAHNSNVIHRDVKPENLLLDEHQNLLLSDFGLAVLSPSPDLLSTQEMAGTIRYMAPEQIRGKPSFASDQYALGIIAYEWFCGTHPFEGAPWEMAHQHLYAAPPRLQEKYSSLPEELEHVVLRALAKDPQQRFVSMQAFAHALERASQLASLDAGSQITSPLNEHVHSPFTSPPLPLITPVLGSTTPPISSPNTEQHGDFRTIPESSTAEKPIAIETTPGPLRVKWRNLLLIALVLVVLIASTVSLFALRINQITTSATHATATASQSTIQALQATYSAATASADANATATAQLNATATLTENPYDANLKTLVLNETLNRNSASRWDETAGSCSFTSEGYHVTDLAQATTPQVCAARNTDFSDLTFQVQMNILKGNGGGILFRSSGSTAYYFRISQDRRYALFACTGVETSCTITLTSAISSWINNGQNQPNLIAIVVKGNRIELYINSELIDGVTNSRAIHGQIGVADVNSEVVFSNAKVWTS